MERDREERESRQAREVISAPPKSEFEKDMDEILAYVGRLLGARYNMPPSADIAMFSCLQTTTRIHTWYHHVCLRAVERRHLKPLS